ncbi:TetR family transcriptional regulator [Antrihabitans sp. YC2-6]|nr:TetR family transcriptional regulator [Antrihabitans sp. YC2-6]
MQHATALFAEKGFAGTSLQDIADAMGLTRPALYHYVANKDELLARLVTEITEQPAQILAGINKRTDLGPVDKLHAMAEAIALHHAAAPDRFRLLVRSETELPDDLSRTHEQSRRRVLKEFISVVGAGIDDGSFRPVDPRVASLAIIGMVNWMAWWYRPDTETSAKSVATQLADMAIHSVLQEGDAGQFADGPARAIGLLRQNLDYLEQQLAEPRARSESPGTL